MGKKPTILCVDDMEERLRIRVLLLQQSGCETLRTQSILALIDYHLANRETGEQVARDVRVLKPHIPLVMLTGDVHLPDHACQCVDAVLTKGSSSPAELLDIIQQLIPDAQLRPRRAM